MELYWRADSNGRERGRIIGLLALLDVELEARESPKIVILHVFPQASTVPVLAALLTCWLVGATTNQV